MFAAAPVDACGPDIHKQLILGACGALFISMPPAHRLRQVRFAWIWICVRLQRLTCKGGYASSQSATPTFVDGWHLSQRFVAVLG